MPWTETAPMNERMRVVPRQRQHEPSVRLDGVRVLVAEDHPDIG